MVNDRRRSDEICLRFAYFGSRSSMIAFLCFLLCSSSWWRSAVARLWNWYFFSGPGIICQYFASQMSTESAETFYSIEISYHECYLYLFEWFWSPQALSSKHWFAALQSMSVMMSTSLWIQVASPRVLETGECFLFFHNLASNIIQFARSSRPNRTDSHWPPHKTRQAHSQIWSWWLSRISLPLAPFVSAASQWGASIHRATGTPASRRRCRGHRVRGFCWTPIGGGWRRGDCHGNNRPFSVVQAPQCFCWYKLRHSQNPRAISWHFWSNFLASNRRVSFVRGPGVCCQV